MTKSSLSEAIDRLDARVAARVAQYRELGRLARRHGSPVEAAPFVWGSWVWLRWLEGWSGTEAPRRDFSLLDGFNMSPAEELERVLDWLDGLGVPDTQRAHAAAKLRAAYRPEFFGGLQ